MADRPPRSSNENACRTMIANRRRDTAPELAVRKRLHAAGLQLSRELPGDSSDRRQKADIVFTRARVVVFIDGCFRYRGPEHYSEPKSNIEYWRPKIARNIARDARSTERPEADGWETLRFWEHEDPDEVAERIHNIVRPQE